MIQPEMNREIASAPKKSEVDFYARRAAALSRPRHRTVHTPPDWLLKRVYGTERSKREKTARRLGARALSWSGPARRALAVSVYFSRNNPTTTERPDKSALGRKFLLYTQINGFSNSKLPNPNSKSQPKPEAVAAKARRYCFLDLLDPSSIPIRTFFFSISCKIFFIILLFHTHFFTSIFFL